MKQWIRAGFGISLLAALLLPVMGLQKTQAFTGSDWQAGRIIDDEYFTDSGSMSVGDIQNFLNQKVGTTQANGTPGVCDTNGVKPSEFGGGTRAQYGAAHGNPAPFTCLKDYYEVPKTDPGAGIPANNYGGAAIPAGAVSAAQIIRDAAQRYSISPKVLLVMIHKESAGPLTTDDWPFRSQYTYAMGAHCPDGPNGAQCDSNYAGFSIQMYESARLLRYYLDNMLQPWWNQNGVTAGCGYGYGCGYPTPYQTNKILYNTVYTNCGSSNVYITNKATAALYTYTPYQPNQAALNNLYGLGDSCSAYGNRNFWRIYGDWFGSPYFSVNIMYQTGDAAVDNTGDLAVIPIRLAGPPLSTIQLNYAVSDTSIAKIVGNASLVFTPSNWNTPQNIVVQGLAAGGSSRNFSLYVAYINSPDGAYSQSITSFLKKQPLLWSSLSERGVVRLYNSSTGKHGYGVSTDIINNLKAKGYAVESTLGYQCPGSTNTPLIVDNPAALVRNIDSVEIVNKEAAAPTISFSNANGSIPVTILKNAASTDTVLSPDATEIATLKQNGYTELTSFLLCRSTDEAVYRLYNPAKDSHFYTASAVEGGNLLGLGFRFEGADFYKSSAGAVPVYRLYNPARGVHFYTVSQAESSAVQGLGFKYEGIAYNVGSTTGAVYRLYNPARDTHFYTDSQAERAAVESLGFKYEGIAYYLY